MKFRILALLLCLSPSAVFACEPGEKLVFSCPTDTRKHVEVRRPPAFSSSRV